jgi:hypothetical protein
MNTRKILIGSGITATALAGAIFAWSTIWPTAPSYAAGVAARHAQFSGHGRGHGHGRGMAMLCSDRRDRKLEKGLAFVEGFVNFTPEQTTAWTELSETVRAGSATIGEKCATLEKAEMPVSAPERMAHFEAIATTGLAILKRVRPAFDRFYATLSDKQKKALDNLISHRGRRS